MLGLISIPISPKDRIFHDDRLNGDRTIHLKSFSDLTGEKDSEVIISICFYFTHVIIRCLYLAPNRFDSGEAEGLSMLKNR